MDPGIEKEEFCWGKKPQGGEGADLSSSPVSLGRAPTTEEDKKAAEKKREDKAKKKHDRKSKRLDEEEEDNEGGEWERVRGGVPLVKVRILERKGIGKQFGRACRYPPGRIRENN